MKILAFCFHKIPSAVIGIVKPLELLQQQGLITFQYMNSLGVTKEMVDEADIIICIRGAEGIDLQWVEQAVASHKRVIYYLDDDLLGINEHIYSYNRSYLEREDIQHNIRTIMERSHILWTSSERIYKRYSEQFDQANVLITPAMLLDDKKVVWEDRECLTLGFAGGIDHRNYYESMLGEPLRQIMSRYANKVKIEIFGFMPFALYYLPITHRPYAEDYEDYMRTMKSLKWDIAVAPLPDTAFHRCKHFNKYLEYGALGIPGIYSNVPPYSDIVTDRENGLLVQNSIRDWYLAIEALIKDKTLRRKMSEHAYQQLAKHYTLEQVAKQIEQILAHIWEER